MSTFPISSITTVYTPGDAGVSQAERDLWMSEMGVASVATETVAAQGVADALAADSKATEAQADADTNASNISTLDGEVVKKTGAQEIAGIKTLTSFAKYSSIPANPSGTQIPRMDDVVAEVNDSGDGWTSSTLLNGWSGSVKTRVDRWGYFEIKINVNKSSATSNTICTVPTASAISYDYSRVVGVLGGVVVAAVLTSVGGGVALTDRTAYPTATYADYIRLPRTVS